MVLGQHFLNDHVFISKIVSYVNFEIRPIIEVGCGKGNLSQYINPDVCIEYDLSFVNYLKKYNLIIADGRELPVIRGQIVSSLPFYITREFLMEISRLNGISRLVLVLQKDVVDKLLNEPTFVSFVTNYFYKLDAKEIIPPKSFYPTPKVFSQIVIMNRINKFDDKVIDILRCVSKYKKKTLRKVVKLCKLNYTSDDKRIEEFKPWQVIELLNLLGIKSV